MHIPRPIFILLIFVLGIQTVLLVLGFFSHHEQDQIVQKTVDRQEANLFVLDSSVRTQYLKSLKNYEDRSELDSIQDTPTEDNHGKDDFDETEIAVQRYASENANLILDNATFAGSWTEKDTLEMLPHLGEMSEQDINMLRERFHTAYNAQELSIENIPPL